MRVAEAKIDNLRKQIAAQDAVATPLVDGINDRSWWMELLEELNAHLPNEDVWITELIPTSGGKPVGIDEQRAVRLAQSRRIGAIVTVTMTNRGKGCTQVPTATATTHGSGHGTDALLTAALSLAGVMCSDGATACYPPVVNYTPLYYLINGVAFDKSNPLVSLFSTSPANGVNGNVLVRIVNAGLRMHVPSIVGSTTGTAAAPGLSLIAEDGNVLPGAPWVQNEVFMPAGKTLER